MSTITCNRCGAAITEEPASQLLICEYCGNEFSTPEHDQRYRDYLENETRTRELELEQRRLDLEEREAEREERAERRSMVTGAALAVGGFFVSLAGRIILLGLGVILLFCSVPLVAQFGVLRRFAPDLIHFYARLPLVGGLLTQLAAHSRQLHVQLIIALILGLGLALVRRRVHSYR